MNIPTIIIYYCIKYFINNLFTKCKLILFQQAAKATFLIFI